MFSGIIKATGIIEKSYEDSGSLFISSSLFSELPQSLGSSIAVDGVCLTVCGIEEQPVKTLKFNLGKETCAKTLLAQYKSSSVVNLEEALRLGDPLDGHLVQGHVDGLIKLVQKVDEADFCRMTFSFDESLDQLLVNKGSVAINGVSLTINEINGCTLSVGLVPYTLHHTSLRELKVGDWAHLETDIVGRYVAKLCLPHLKGAKT